MIKISEYLSFYLFVIISYVCVFPCLNSANFSCQLVFITFHFHESRFSLVNLLTIPYHANALGYTRGSGLDISLIATASAFPGYVPPR